MQEILLATDLDGTLIGNDEALRSLNGLFMELMSSHHLKLAYVTGRSLASYDQLAADKSLLKPDALVTAVGTEIYWNGTDLVADWPKDGAWNREAIVDAVSDIPDLTWQPESEQQPHKVSFYLKDSSEALGLVREKLRHYPVDILYSHQKYLDILPRGINKGSALTYLAARWKVNHENIIACGDSANDIDMLAVSKAIIVGSARQELLDWASRNFRANIYLASNTFAAGIEEGLRHFQVA